MFVTAKKILKDAGFNLRKFYSSSGALQARVSPLEHPQETLPAEELEESYASLSLGGEQKLHSGEQKVLGMWWNMSVDQLLIGFEEKASAARALTPMKHSALSQFGRPILRPHRVPGSGGYSVQNLPTGALPSKD